MNSPKMVHACPANFPPSTAPAAVRLAIPALEESSMASAAANTGSADQPLLTVEPLEDGEFAPKPCD